MTLVRMPGPRDAADDFCHYCKLPAPAGSTANHSDRSMGISIIPPWQETWKYNDICKLMSSAGFRNSRRDWQYCRRSYGHNMTLIYFNHEIIMNKCPKLVTHTHTQHDIIIHNHEKYSNQLGVSKNRGGPPKRMVYNGSKPFLTWMIWGVKPPLFLVQHPVCASLPPKKLPVGDPFCLEPNALSCFHCSDTTGEVHSDHPNTVFERTKKCDPNDEKQKKHIQKRGAEKRIAMDCLSKLGSVL